MTKKAKNSTEHWFKDVPLDKRFDKGALKIASSFVRLISEHKDMTAREVIVMLDVASSTYYRRKKELNIISRRLRSDELKDYIEEGRISHDTAWITVISVTDVRRMMATIKKPDVQNAAEIISATTKNLQLEASVFVESFKPSDGSSDIDAFLKNIEKRMKAEASKTNSRKTKANEVQLVQKKQLVILRCVNPL